MPPLIFLQLASIVLALSSTTCHAVNVQCGRMREDTKAQSRARRAIIVGGTDTEDGVWRWILSIGIPGSHCGATLIGDRWVLTAAHCVDPPLPSDYKLYGSAYKVNMTKDAIPLAIKNQATHPGYVMGSNASQARYDFGIIELAERINFTVDGDLTPVCLPASDDGVVFNPKQKAIALGWGSQNTPTKKPKLQMASMFYKQPTVWCPRQVNKAAEFCAQGVPSSSGICDGDSGGPLLTKHNDAYFLYGVTSLGAMPGGVCWTQVGGIFARVTAACPWIEEFTKGEVKCIQPSKA